MVCYMCQDTDSGHAFYSNSHALIYFGFVLFSFLWVFIYLFIYLFIKIFSECVLLDIFLLGLLQVILGCKREHHANAKLDSLRRTSRRLFGGI
jgi:hypothetical protein